jgi:hypothetical protein
LINPKSDEIMKTKNYPMLAALSVLSVLPLTAFAGQGPGGPPSVPEPSTILAGVAMLIPLGAAAVHALRKPRK